MKQPLLTVIVPIYNEEGNVKKLYYEVRDVMISLMAKKTISDYEFIYVNDGSKDNTQNMLLELKEQEKNHLKVIELRKNFGQTPALKAGFDESKGDLIVTMDGDLQNDPRDIPRLIEKLKEGYDVVSGWRFNRKDKFTKRISSKIMNFMRKKMIGDNLQDYGCALKIYRRECVKDLELFGELHRFITAYLYIRGYKIGEIKVNHRPRVSGTTKYKFNRGLNGLLDLFYLKFWSGYSNKPLHFFGRLGIYQIMLALIIAFEQVIKAFVIQKLTLGPLLLLSALLVLSGLFFIFFGFLSEMISRNYFTENKKIYSVKTVN